MGTGNTGAPPGGRVPYWTERKGLSYDQNLVNLGEVPAYVTPSTAQNGHLGTPGVDGVAQSIAFNILPWWQAEIPSAQDFYLENLTTVYAAGTTTVVPSFSLTVGQGQIGVIRSLQITVQNPTATIKANVGLLLSGAPIQGWSAININPLVAAASIQVYNDMVIRLGQNTVVTAQVVNTDSVPWTISVLMQGWVCPLNDVQRLQGTLQY